MISPTEPPAADFRDEPPRQFSLRGVLIGVTLVSVLIALLVAVGTPAAFVGGFAICMAVFPALRLTPCPVALSIVAGIVLTYLFLVLALINIYGLDFAGGPMPREWYIAALAYSSVMGGFFGGAGAALADCGFTVINFLDRHLPGGERGLQATDATE